MSLTLIFKELRQLQTSLQKTSDRLWTIRKSITAAYQHGHTERDFLPRRLVALKNEEEIRFDALLGQLKTVIASKLLRSAYKSNAPIRIKHAEEYHPDMRDSVGRALFPLNSPDDVNVIAGIRKTIRYIRNAFAGEPPLNLALDRLHRLLPRRGAANG